MVDIQLVQTSPSQYWSRHVVDQQTNKVVTSAKAGKKVVSISPGLHNFAGHEYQYTKAVLEVAQKRGYDVFGWGRSDAGDKIRAESWFMPLFSRIRYDRAGDPFLLRVVRLIRRERAWYGELKRALANEVWHAGDIVFVNTFSVYSIWQWWLLQDWFAQRKIHLILFLRYPPVFVAGYLRPAYRFFYRRLGITSKYVHLLTASEELKTEYLRISPQPVHVVHQILPLPMDVKSKSVGEADASVKASVKVGYVGGARLDKGFHLLPEAVEEVNRRMDGVGTFFRIQCSPPGTDCYEAKCLAALERLRKLRSRAGNIELLESSLSPEQYQELVNSLDIVLLPYLKDEYYLKVPSQIFAEAVAAGKLCVVSRDTWLAQQVDELGWGETFEAGNPEDMACSITRALHTWQLGERLPADKQRAWTEKHDPARLVDFLLELAK